MHLVVLRNVSAPFKDTGRAQVIEFADLRGRGIRGLLREFLFRYSSLEMQTYDLRVVTRPFATGVLLRFISRGRCEFVDRMDARERIGPRWLLLRFARWVRDWLSIPALKQRSAARLGDLRRARESVTRHMNCGTPLYLRTDLWFGVRSGGSVGHVAGVVNSLASLGRAPHLVSSDELPLISTRIATHLVTPPDQYRDFPELWAYHYGEVLARDLILTETSPGFIYQRYSHNNISGLSLARHWRVPLVIEYNGSEIWMGRNWGRPLKHGEMAAQIEAANIELADLVVVVSEPSRAELETRGLRARHVLVNPNGVDPDVYRPDLNGSVVRERLGLQGKFVFGFIGTFGRWHGAEILVEAFGSLIERRPELRTTTRLLMIGDGITMPEVRRIAARLRIEGQVVLAGMVPQQEGPAHLAACDVFVSPHVPNADGTRFFGSPTKLFEYMAMGRPIVASDLEQVGAILRHEVTAILVEPGNCQTLSRGMERAHDDVPLAAAIAASARHVVCENYTWRAHTERIIATLGDIAAKSALDRP